MPAKLYQNILYQFSSAIDRKVGLLDDSELTPVLSDINFVAKNITEIFKLAELSDEPFTYNGYTFLGFPVYFKPEYIVFVEGEDELAKRYVQIISISISSMKQMDNNKYDKSNFLKNVILDNILPGEILVKAKDLHLSYDTHRVVMLVRSHDLTDSSVYEIVQSIFPEKNRDFVISIDEYNTVLIAEVNPDTPTDALEKTARTIIDTIAAEAMTKVMVGIGSVVHTVKDLSKAYKDARVALEVRKVFDSERDIINYNCLGIGRLIYQLPTTLCELFLTEVFQKESLDILDSETIYTIQKFFENNLNVSETSRQLYVHRNTLVYRLDKVQKLTGLDLRQFEHAIVFKIAMMVKRYLDSSPVKI